ncbi:serine/threonine protein kinase [Leeia sp. TBRC 13508]|uniref:non-specific serine/threonine protein kinase n=1 Tax=Leeia speluncae TaxID=2884804 RepID=A0ABS8D5L8_9NEIS|nr:serine/threonine-protein kinase [Leeia speluncae]MCB6183298.1 serine/threonine protein kinase [Leeia speluncae]
MGQQANLPLPRGYQLQNYTIVKPLSSGGFSIVYLAHDENDQPVAIKEYMPSSLVLRVDGEIVNPENPEYLPTFRYGLKCFFEEGKALAGINHPNVVRVINFFRANETVYMVMSYERGRTLQREIQLRQNETMKESMIRLVFGQLLNGLREVHLHKLLHLDIKPANIYIRQDGTPLLLDFGSARQTFTQNNPRLSPMFTPGFAPPEQYRDRDNLGPWSDIYSVGASIYACMAAHAPQPGDQRAVEDKYVSASKLWNGVYSKHLLEIVDWCLEKDFLNRPQSVLQIQKELLRNDYEIPEPKLSQKIRSFLTQNIFPRNR